MSHCRSLSVFCLALVFLAPILSAELVIPKNPNWKPVQDEVYLQETAMAIQTGQPLTSVAVLNGAVYAGDASGLYRLDGDTLKKEAGPAGAVHRLKVAGGAVWAMADDGLWRLEGPSWIKVSEAPVTDVCEHTGQVLIAHTKGIYALDGNALSAEPVFSGSASHLASYAGTVYTHTPNRLGAVYQGRLEYDQVADWGSLPRGCNLRDLLSWGSKLYVATDEGLAVLRGMTWYSIRGADGLCHEDTTCLARGFADDLWIGTAQGAIRNVNGEYQYFAGQRWLPNDKVNAIACGTDKVYLATDGGLSVIAYEPYTLQKKADWYENWMEEWGMKRLGFIHLLVWDDAGKEWIREVSDNDVGYSSHYFDALCFKYAVTRDPAVRAEALDMMKSMKWSEEISGIPGFPARSIWAVGELGLQAQHGSGGLPAEWHATADGKWQWKGDTSSDEIDAHIYATSLFLELVAQTDDERAMATDHLRRVVGHIVDNGWYLRDVDGKPTRWARWDMEYFHTEEGMAQWGLNGLEALGFVTTAQHFTGDDKFKAGKQQLIEWGYPEHVLRQKLTFHPGYWCPFDDRLAFYAYYPLLRYETDSALRSTFLMSLERSWEVKRIEAVPWFNFIYGAVTGNDCEETRAVAHLREWPLDMRLYSFRNSNRADLNTPKGYTMYNERIRPLSPRETGGRRWDSDFMELDGGAHGNMVADPGGWLDAYWMGRYYGFITAPATKDPRLTAYPRTGQHQGAKPYTGPPRPPVWNERQP